MSNLYEAVLKAAQQAREALDTAFQASRIAKAETAEIQRRLMAIAEIARLGKMSEARHQLQAEWGMA